MPTKYIFVINDDNTQCKVYKPSRNAAMPDKYLGKVTLAPGGRVVQDFAHDVQWLPVNRALAALGILSEKDAIMKELGY